MTPCLDIHTHHAAPQPQAVVATGPKDFNPLASQLYSIGIHPWEANNLPSNLDWADFELVASLPEVVAIGECGIDKLKLPGIPLFKQLIVMTRQIEISEKLKKPLVIHDVKAHDVIVGLKRDMEITQKWVVHGFRGKPTVAKMLTDAGIYLSFGEKFNPDSLPVVPRRLILAETDESPLSIEEIIKNLSVAAGEDMTSLIARNTATFLYGEEILQEDNATKN